MRRAVVAVVVALSLASPAQAWSARGHRAIAEIAYDLLSEAAREEAAELLGEGRAAFVATAIWADTISARTPDLWDWHLVDRPIDADAYDPAEHCFSGNCMIPIVEQLSVALANRHNSRAARTEALKWLIHLVGEIHSPLHVAHDFDSWGEDTWIKVGETVVHLHQVWDTNLVHALGATPRAVADAAMAKVDDATIAEWRGGTAMHWAEESFVLARDVVYARSRGINRKSNPHVMPERYLAEASVEVARRLAMAGVRLAWLLERTLVAPPAGE